MDFGHISTLSNHYQAHINTNAAAPLSSVSRLQREKQIDEGERGEGRGGTGECRTTWKELDFDGAAQACCTRAWAHNLSITQNGSDNHDTDTADDYDGWP